MVLARVEFEHRVSFREMMTDDKPGRLELRQNTVNRREAEVVARGHQRPIDILGAHVPITVLLQEGKDLDPRLRRLQTSVLQLVTMHRSASASDKPAAPGRPPVLHVRPVDLSVVAATLPFRSYPRHRACSGTWGAGVGTTLEPADIPSAHHRETCSRCSTFARRFPGRGAVCRAGRCSSELQAPPATQAIAASCNTRLPLAMIRPPFAGSIVSGSPRHPVITPPAFSTTGTSAQ